MPESSIGSRPASRATAFRAPTKGQEGNRTYAAALDPAGLWCHFRRDVRQNDGILRPTAASAKLVVPSFGNISPLAGQVRTRGILTKSFRGPGLMTNGTRLALEDFQIGSTFTRGGAGGHSKEVSHECGT